MGTRILEIPYPEDLPKTLSVTPEEFEREFRFLVANKLYEMDRVSSGRAAELTGINRVEFLEGLGRYQISVLNYSLEELEREVGEAQARTGKAS